MANTCERSAQQIIEDSIESLDNIQGRIERGEKLLQTAKELLIDYCYTSGSPVKNKEVQFPKEIEISMQLLSLVMDDMEFECDCMNQEKREMDILSVKIKS